jgi:biotin operon repressor
MRKDRIKALLQEYYSPAEIAKQVGISRQAIHKMAEREGWVILPAKARRWGRVLKSCPEADKPYYWTSLIGFGSFIQELSEHTGLTPTDTRWVLRQLHLRCSKGIKERFENNTDKSGGPDACWPWVGPKSAGFGITYYKHERPAHRVAWMLANQVTEIPVRAQVRHTCRTCACVNPKHLYLHKVRKKHILNLRSVVQKGETNEKTDTRRKSTVGS